jgi:hypothetical protein
LVLAGVAGGGGGFFVADAVEFVGVIVGEVRYVKKSIAFETKVDEGGLHAWEDPGDASFMDTASEGVLVGALEEDLYEDVVLKNSHLGFVAVGRNY